jgi:spore coat protein U-like protein
MDLSLRSLVRVFSIALILPAALAPAATKTAKFNVTATVQNDCTVAATDLAFGTVGLLSSNVDSTSTLTITCTPTTAYKVGLDAGNVTGSTVDNRLMASGTTTMRYQLYSDTARTQVWRDSVDSTVGGTGSGVAQSMTVYGRIPVQTTPAVGSYLAQVTATITY